MRKRSHKVCFRKNSQAVSPCFSHFCDRQTLCASCLLQEELSKGMVIMLCSVCPFFLFRDRICRSFKSTIYSQSSRSLLSSKISCICRLFVKEQTEICLIYLFRVFLFFLFRDRIRRSFKSTICQSTTGKVLVRYCPLKFCVFVTYLWKSRQRYV